jgi:hypothetical protein
MTQVSEKTQAEAHHATESNRDLRHAEAPVPGVFPGRAGRVHTVPALPELAVFGTNIKQARIAAATAIEALAEDLEANGVPVAISDPLAAGMTENIERMIRVLSGRPELMAWLDRQRSLYAVSAYAPNG